MGSQRYLFNPLKDHLAKLRQVVFLVGPRQVGKTTLAKALIPEPYWNWDSPSDRQYLLRHLFTGNAKDIILPPARMVLDEIHKYPRWKNTLKGLFDTHEPHTHWIVTGSARLDVYRRGQDSMLGRAFTYHLNPFSVAELAAPSTQWALPRTDAPSIADSQEAFQMLLRFSGFPEPLFRGSDAFRSRWATERLSLLVHEDLAKIENLKSIALVESLALLLRSRAGQLLSLNNLREDLEVHFETVKHWLELLERVFYGFRLKPFSRKVTRGLRKEAKWYLWDWAEAETDGARFENLVAVHLLKFVQFGLDLGLGEPALFYIRNKEKKEIDFVLTEKNKPVAFVECKWADPDPDSSLRYYQQHFPNCRFIQLVGNGLSKRTSRGHGPATVEIWPAHEFLAGLI